MAVLQAPPVSSPFGDLPLAPGGTFAAICIDVVDQFGVTKRKWQSEELETLDVTTFLFEFRSGPETCRVATGEMRISGHPKAALFKFLRSWLGKPPAYNWDYCELKGSPALVTIEHVQRHDGQGMWAKLSNVSPMPTAPGQGLPQPEAPAGCITETAPAPAPFGPLVPGPAPHVPDRYDVSPPPVEDPADEIPF